MYWDFSRVEINSIVQEKLLWSPYILSWWFFFLWGGFKKGVRRLKMAVNLMDNHDTCYQMEMAVKERFHFLCAEKIKNIGCNVALTFLYSLMTLLDCDVWSFRRLVGFQWRRCRRQRYVPGSSPGGGAPRPPRPRSPCDSYCLTDLILLTGYAVMVNNLN